eukprot:217520_1
MALETKETIQILAVLTVCICLKFFFVTLGSGWFRTRAPEDGFQTPVGKRKESDSGQNLNPPVEDENANEQQNQQKQRIFNTEYRWKRIVQNDMENIPITIILMWIAVIAQGNNETNVAFAVMFLFGRTMHTICYIYSLQPWRSIVWGLAFFSTIGFLINILYGAFNM